jgi:hypothetical protein
MPSNGSAFSGSEMRDHPKARRRDFNSGESEPTALQQATARNSDLEPQSLPAEYLLGTAAALFATLVAVTARLQEQLVQLAVISVVVGRAACEAFIRKRRR